MASKVDTLLPPCHPFNHWFVSGQDCDILSQLHRYFHHSRVGSGGGSILVVSFGDSVTHNNLLCISFHLLGVYEGTNNPYFRWLFNFDCMEYLWSFLEKLTGFHRPRYISDEIDAQRQVAGIHPPLTGYRIIVTVVVAIIGLIRSTLLYGQETTEATVVECVFGVGIVTGYVKPLSDT